MKIIELNILEFGSLKDKHLALEDGLNIIMGDNESGKSTVALFIKFMLYGLGRKTQKSVDRARALSFDGQRAAGTMTLVHGGTAYQIERRAVMSGKLSESCRFRNMDTGELLTQVPGELLFGVGADVFESSTYIAQMHASDVKGVQTGNAIQNMLSSADESVNTDKTLSKMDSVRKEYKHKVGSGGLIYDTQDQIMALKLRYSRAVEKDARINELEARLARTNESIGRAVASHASTKKQLEDINDARILQRFCELSDKKDRLSALENEESELVSQHTADNFVPERAHVLALEGLLEAYEEAKEKHAERARAVDMLMPVSDEQRRLSRDGEAIKRAGGKQELVSQAEAFDAKAKKHSTLGIVFSILGIVAAVSTGAVFALIPQLYLLLSLGGACALSAVLAGVFFRRASKKRADRDAFCAGYGVPYSEFESFCSNCLTALEHCESADRAALSAKAVLGYAYEEREFAHRRLLDLLKKTAPAACESADISSVCAKEIKRLGDFCSRREQLKKEIYTQKAIVSGLSHELESYDEATLREKVKIDLSTLTPQAIERAKTAEQFDGVRLGKLRDTERTQSIDLAALRAEQAEDPIELADKICVLEQKLCEDTEFYESLVLAMEHMEAASNVMKTSATPEISRRASEMMAYISNGAHSSLQTTKTFDLSLEQNGFSVDSALLSGGTRDAAYICLRLALAFRLFGDELPPLVLDESLCQLDDARVKRLLTLLDKLSPTVQSILLTCHTREERLCSELGIAKNIAYFSFEPEK